MTVSDLRKWAASERALLEQLAPVAVYVAGDLDQEIAGIPGVMRRAVVVGTTAAWRDTISSTIDRFSPMVARGLLLRLWTRSDKHADLLCAAMRTALLEQGEPRRYGWIDVRRPVAIGDLERLLRELAQDRVEVWSDAEIHAHIQALDRARGRQLERV